MAMLIVEEVIWHDSQSSSAAESEAGKADGEDLDSFTHPPPHEAVILRMYNSQMTYMLTN